MIIWGRDPGPEPQHSKLDDAIDRGFDPGEDHGGQPVDTDAPLSPRLARWVHQGSETGCEECGNRCSSCGDRMCQLWGPEPRACSTVCADCRCDCSACIGQREDMRADLQHTIYGEEGR